MRQLRRLRSLNKDAYMKALEILKIKGVIFLDPFDFGEGSESDKLKNEAKTELYQVKIELT